MPMRAALAICWRCAVLLAVAAVVVGFVAHPGRVPESSSDDTVTVMAMMYAVHLAVLAVLGLPLGWVLSARLGPGASVGRSVGVFAAAGALAAGVVLAVLLAAFSDVVSGWALVPGWAALGGVVAGLSRWWAHPGIRRRGAPDE